MGNLNAKEAAAFLKISEAWLSKTRCYGGGPRYSKVGARVVYCRHDLDEFLERHSRSSTSDADAAEVVHA